MQGQPEFLQVCIQWVNGFFRSPQMLSKDKCKVHHLEGNTMGQGLVWELVGLEHCVQFRSVV